MIQAPYEHDPFTLMVEFLKTVGYCLLPEHVIVRTGIISVDSQIGLTIVIMASPGDGIGIRHGGSIHGITFGIAVYKMYRDIIGKGQPQCLNLAVGRFY